MASTAAVLWRDPCLALRFCAVVAPGCRGRAGTIPSSPAGSSMMRNLFGPDVEAELTRSSRRWRTRAQIRSWSSPCRPCKASPSRTTAISSAATGASAPKEINNGVLLIVAPNERKVRIEVGHGLEGDPYRRHCRRSLSDGAIVPKLPRRRLCRRHQGGGAGHRARC